MNEQIKAIPGVSESHVLDALIWASEFIKAANLYLGGGN
jgi:hypothetical protein